MCPHKLHGSQFEILCRAVYKTKHIFLKVTSGSKIVGKKNRPEGSFAQGR